MLPYQNPVNGWEVNSLVVNSGDAVSPKTSYEPSASIYAEVILRGGFLYLMYNRQEIEADTIRRVVGDIDLQSEVSVNLRDWSDADEVRVDVNMFEPIGIIFDNYVKETFYPLDSRSSLDCGPTIARPLFFAPFETTASLEAEYHLIKWAYFLNSDSDMEPNATIGKVAAIEDIEQDASARAMGSIVNGADDVQIRNTSDMIGGEGVLYVDGFPKMDLDSNDCCVYPEAQTEKDIDCNGN